MEYDCFVWPLFLPWSDNEARLLCELQLGSGRCLQTNIFVAALHAFMCPLDLQFAKSGMTVRFQWIMHGARKPIKLSCMLKPLHLFSRELSMDST
jgi:hypothetical protein